MFVLSIIGTILLWVLIVLLGLVALVLLILLIIWVAPLKYRADVSAKKEGEGKFQTNIQAKGRWLYGLVRFTVSGNDVVVKVLWFTVNKEKKATDEEKPGETNVADALAEKPNEQDETKAASVKENDGVKPNAASAKNDDNDTAEKEGFFTRMKNKVTGYKATYDSVMKHPDRPEIQAHLWALVKKLLKRFKPRDFWVSGVIGFDSPDKTGMAIGALCAVRGMTNFNIRVDGDFDNQVIDINAHIADKLRLCQILYPALRFCLRKKVRPHLFGLLSSK